MTNVEQYRILAFQIVSYLSPLAVEQNIQRLVMSRSYWTAVTGDGRRDPQGLSHSRVERAIEEPKPPKRS